jgi:hypothetical protein
MRVFGWHISKWWLLLFVPVCVLALPLLLMGFFAANSLAGAIIGPPAIWNRPWHSPPREDLVGRYVETERHWNRPKTGPDAVLELNRDGSMRVSAFPYEFWPNTCTLSGTGRWSGPDEDRDIILAVTSDGAPGSCESGSYSYIEIARHSKPYDLYWILGDPDSGTGVWLKRQ